MTLFKNFKSQAPDQCPQCGCDRISDRPARPMPWLLQTLFGLSFVLFLVATEKKWLLYLAPWIKPTIAVWVWSAIQIILGVLLAKGRFQARIRIFRCLRCGATVS